MKRRGLAILTFAGLVALVVWHWNEMIVTAAVWNTCLRDHVLAQRGNLDTKYGMVEKAKGIDGEAGYALLSKCYLALARDYEDGVRGGEDGAAELFHNAFGGYANLYYGTPGFDAELERYEKLRVIVEACEGHRLKPE